MPSAPTPRTTCCTRRLTLCLASLALLLGGCASVLRLENDVSSFTAWPNAATPAQGDLFAFERLPSQKDAQAMQSQQTLENLARPALEKAGLKPANDAAKARWTVQVNARGVKLPRAPWEDPFDRWPGWGMPGRDYVVTGKGQVVYMPGLLHIPTPYYQREVSVLIRDAKTGQVVYESKAAHDGPWHDSPALWNALFDAALQGFPRPPAGPRRVVIDLPR